MCFSIDKFILCPRLSACKMRLLPCGRRHREHLRDTKVDDFFDAIEPSGEKVVPYGLTRLNTRSVCPDPGLEANSVGRSLPTSPVQLVSLSPSSLYIPLISF